MQQTKKMKKNAALIGGFPRAMKFIFIKLLQLFVRADSKRILFISQQGESFDGTVRTAFELLQADPAYADFTFVWAFDTPNDFDDARISKKIKANTWFYFYHLLHAKYWISNDTVEQYIAFKHPNNVYIQFGQGIPVERVGNDSPVVRPVVKKWFQKVEFDYQFTYGNYDTEQFKRIFPAAHRYNEVGQLQKKALLTLEKTFRRDEFLEGLRLNPNKPTLLYAPAWRCEDEQVNHLAYLGREALVSLTEKYNVIYRGRQTTPNLNGIVGIAIANEIDINELFLASDVLVTDYSNVMFDFAATLKPIYLYAADLVEYEEKGRLYMSLEELALPIATHEKELLKLLADPTQLSAMDVEDVLTFYNPAPAQKTVDFLFEIVPTND